MQWTGRMQEAADFLDAHRQERNGRGPTCRQLGDHLGGISVERARQLVASIHRYRKIPRPHDEHVRLWHRLRVETLERLMQTRTRQSLKTRAMVDNRRAIHRVLKGFAMLAGLHWADTLPASALAYPQQPKPEPPKPEPRAHIDDWLDRRRAADYGRQRAARQRQRRKQLEQFRLQWIAELAADPELAKLDALYRQRARRGDSHA